VSRFKKKTATFCVCTYVESLNEGLLLMKMLSIDRWLLVQKLIDQSKSQITNKTSSKEPEKMSSYSTYKVSRNHCQTSNQGELYWNRQDQRVLGRLQGDQSRKGLSNIFPRGALLTCIILQRVATTLLVNLSSEE
jgi:hypothetical protein